MSDVLIGAAWALVFFAVLAVWAAYGPVAGLLLAVVALLGVIVVRLGHRNGGAS